MNNTQESFVGFWKTSEYYCRGEKVTPLPLGSIIVTLSETAIDRTCEEATALLEREQYSTASCDKAIQLIAQCLQDDPVWSHPVLRDHLCDVLLSEELHAHKKVAHYLEVLKPFIEIKKELLAVLPETLLRRDKEVLPPVVHSTKYFELHPDVARKFAIGGSPVDHFITVIKDETADLYDETKGLRMITAFSTNSLRDVVNMEFCHMISHNVSLAICNYCHRYFLPLTVASNFCDRPIDGDDNRTCKSISTHWYVRNRRNANPAWDEYILYRNRYNCRTSRNRTKNPGERLEQWNRWARQLVQSYDNGELSIEDVSKALKEKDEEMKPLG